MSPITVGIVSIIVHQLLIGISPVVYKLLSTSIPSPVIIVVRWGLGASVLLGWLILTHAWKKLFRIHTWKHAIGLLFLGLFGAGLASLWNVIAVRHIGVVLSSLLVNLELPLGVFFGVLFLHEKLTATYIKAAAMIAIGFLLLVVKNGIILPSGGSYLSGVLYALGAAVIWGSCTLVGKKLTATLAPSVVSFWRLALGGIANSLLIAIYGYDLTTLVSHVSVVDWGYLVWLGVVTSGVGMVLYYKALAVLSIKHISLLFTISPIVSVLLGVATGEKPLLSQWFGIILILSGIAYVFAKKEHV